MKNILNMKYLKKFEKYGEETYGVIKHEKNDREPYVLAQNGKKYYFRTYGFDYDEIEVFDLCTKEIDGQGSWSRKEIKPYVGMVVRFKTDYVGGGYDYTIFKEDQKEEIKKEIININNYLNQIEYGDYKDLPQFLFDMISMEGWLVNIEEEYNEEYYIDDFEYLTLELSDEDKKGLKNMDKNVVEKFSKLDLELKKQMTYPYDTLDFIDYDKGVVHIIRLV